MTILLAIASSGFGALARLEVAEAVQRRTGNTRPWGTSLVNLTGALALGILAGLHERGGVSDAVTTVVGAGFLGGFTTFSTWMVDSAWLAEDRHLGGVPAAALNLAGMLALGIAAAAVTSTLL